MAASDSHTSTVKDVKQLGIWAALGSLGYVFWICGGMEMVERLAYYGVRQVSSLYATDAKSNGGLGLVGTDIGTIFLVWALVQSFVPVFTGGISDRVGYKETIFCVDRVQDHRLPVNGVVSDLLGFHGWRCGTGVWHGNL